MQHLLVIGSAIIILAVGIALYITGYKQGQSLSLHIASHRKVYLLYGIMVTLGVLLLAVFGYVWLTPELNLGPLFLVLYSLGLFCVIFTAWIPDVPGWRRLPHYVAAYGIVGLLPIIELTVLIGRGQNTATIIVGCAALIVQMYILYMFFLVPKARSKFAVYQMVYVIAFFVSLLAVTYLR